MSLMVLPEVSVPFCSLHLDEVEDEISAVSIALPKFQSALRIVILLYFDLH